MWINLLERFQNLVVGVAGFLGVVLTLWYNARQARRQRREEQQHERQTLRAALIEELRIHRGSLVRNVARANDIPEEGGCFVPTDAMDDAYRAFTHRIGLLSRTEVRKVMYAYLTLRAFMAGLFLIGVPSETGDRHVKVPARNRPVFLDMLDSLTRPIDEAIEAMERAHDAEVGCWFRRFARKTAAFLGIQIRYPAPPE